MSTRNRIPEAIQPFLRLPLEASLTILTGTLGCNTSWFTSRFIGSAVARFSGTTEKDGDEGGGCSLVFVSWLRDLVFWKNEIRRSMGVDISEAIDGKRLSFVDCLSEHSILSQTDPLTAIRQVMFKAIGDFTQANQTSRILLVLDNADVLLACGSATAQQLNLFMLELRSMVHATIITCSADQPLLNPTSQANDVHTTPFEIETSGFLTQQAHNARLVISMRELATGAARDISGVLRVTRSACAYDEDEAIEGMEALYLVQRDGGVKVFQRGTDSV